MSSTGRSEVSRKASSASAGSSTEESGEASVNSREADLSEALSQISSAVAGAASLEQVLEHVTNSAHLAIPGADGVGIALFRLGEASQRVQAVAASRPFVQKVDAVQYELVREGPCITAGAESRPAASGNLSGDPRWPRFGPRAGRLGVHSALALPMLLPDGTVVGAINAYSRARDSFDERTIAIGLLFAAPAGLAVYNAQVLAEAETRAQQLQAALVSRAVIDQAIGILRSRSGETADEAFLRLRSVSQHENVKLSLVAERIVEEAVRRARARHSGP